MYIHVYTYEPGGVRGPGKECITQCEEVSSSITFPGSLLVLIVSVSQITAALVIAMFIQYIKRGSSGDSNINQYCTQKF